MSHFPTHPLHPSFPGDYSGLPPPSQRHSAGHAPPPAPAAATSKQKARAKRNEGAQDAAKRRCVSTACIACRKRKSKCDGNTPACAACSSVYGTECVYDPNSDHRRRGVYRQDIDNLQDRSQTLQTLIEAILNYAQDDVPDLVSQIRSCESLDALAQRIQAKERGAKREDSDDDEEDDGPAVDAGLRTDLPVFESQLSNKLGQLRVDSGSTRFFGGTSNLVYFGEDVRDEGNPSAAMASSDDFPEHANPVVSWSNVTSDPELIVHLLNMYFTWHYTFFVVLSKSSFYQHFMLGKPRPGFRRKVEYCTPLLVNAMLALGCHFTAQTGAYEDAADSATAGDHFFREAKRLITEEEEYEHPRLATVQALALMSVREAGCGREAKGWTYSGIAFRMACDLGLNLDAGGIASKESNLDEEEEDARRMTFWGCFLIDKCWSNYLGRLPHFQSSVNITCPKFDVFPNEEAGDWTPFTDRGFGAEHTQPSRVRTVGRHLMDLCDISSDLMKYFYHPQEVHSPPSKQAEIKRLGEIHTRLETWKRELPSELEPREGALPSVLVMHMFFHLLYIHLFRPFLKYDPKTSPLPSNVSPRRQCTHGAAAISKLLRLYKRSYGLRQICNIVVYIAHSACTIHLLNLPDKNAKRDINHGVKQLEEIASSWLCARRTLSVLSMQARKWKVDLPEEAAQVLQKIDQDYGEINDSSSSSPRAAKTHSIANDTTAHARHMSGGQDQDFWSSGDGFASINLMSNDQSLLDALDASLDSMVQQSPNIGYGPTPNVSAASSTYAGSMGVPATSRLQSPNTSLQPMGSVRVSPSEQSPQWTWPQNGSDSASTTPLSAPGDPNLFQQHFTMTNANKLQHAIQRTQAPAPGPMQPPPLPRSQRSAHQPPTPRQPPTVPQSTPTPTQQSQSRPKREQAPARQHQQQQPRTTSARRPSATDAMFGGVQALLSESQDFWLHDQSKIASGFGNWHASTTASSASAHDAAGGGPSPASSTASGGVNMDAQCGVADAATGGAPCARALDCDAHSLAAKRAAPGRSRPFDVLAGAELGRRWEAERRGEAGRRPGGGGEDMEWCG